ncbi:MAG: right-handed parallel beta-helix repeat-containing protein [Limisphaerales bacterium]
MKKIITTIVALCLALIGSVAHAAVYYVSPEGDDAYPGTSVEQPFRVVQHGIDRMKAGDTLVVMDGVYAGTVELKSGITLRARNPRKVIFSGAERVESNFESVSGNVYRAKLGEDIKQVFFEGKPMTWAQWPNNRWSENREANKKWATCSEGTGPGVIVSDRFPEIAKLDLRGGHCFIRYSLGNSCYSRRIESFDGKTLRWDDDDFYRKARSGGDGINASPEMAASVSRQKYAPSNSLFFLAGDIDLLDAPGEWFVDQGWLYLIPPNGADPNAAVVMVKTNDYSIAGEKAVSGVSIEGIDFFSTSINLPSASNRDIAFKNVQFTYIGAELLFVDRKLGREIDKPIRVNGSGISFVKCLFAGAQNSALKVTGAEVTVDNCVFMENNRHANFETRALYLEPEGDYQLTRNSFFNNGSDSIFIVPNLDKMDESVRPEISHNHIFNGGLYNTDCSGVYMPTRSQRHANIHHNWMHNINGVAMRVDLGGSEVSIHHNVFWKSQKALSIEGYRDFNIYNNTGVHNRSYSMIIRNVIDHAGLRGEGSGDRTFPPIDDWNVLNNLIERFFDKAASREMAVYKKAHKAGTAFAKRNAKSLMSVSDRGSVQGNIQRFDRSIFVHGELDQLNLIPVDPLVKGGVEQNDELAAQGVTQLDSFRGAYDVNGDNWAPGSEWMPYGLPVMRTMAEAEQFARKYGNLSITPDVRLQGLKWGSLSFKGETSR